MRVRNLRGEHLDALDTIEVKTGSALDIENGLSGHTLHGESFQMHPVSSASPGGVLARERLIYELADYKHGTKNQKNDQQTKSNSNLDALIKIQVKLGNRGQ
ncbi:hypothetical protein AZSI13_07690 [Azospira sp. I13]|nr:hypothetical protein AZSI13_07690 [Azospira sp. I13]